MSKKLMKDLMPGDEFKDSLGEWLKVEQISLVGGITKLVKIHFVTPRGAHMFMNYSVNRAVEYRRADEQVEVK